MLRRIARRLKLAICPPKSQRSARPESLTTPSISKSSGPISTLTIKLARSTLVPEEAEANAWPTTMVNLTNMSRFPDVAATRQGSVVLIFTRKKICTWLAGAAVPTNSTSLTTTMATNMLLKEPSTGLFTCLGSTLTECRSGPVSMLATGRSEPIKKEILSQTSQLRVAQRKPNRPPQSKIRGRDPTLLPTSNELRL